MTRAMRLATGFASMPTNRRPDACASSAVVPPPEKGSSTRSPSTDSSSMSCRGSSRMNLAGYGCTACRPSATTASAKSQSSAASRSRAATRSSRSNISAPPNIMEVILSSAADRPKSRSPYSRSGSARQPTGSTKLWGQRPRGPGSGSTTCCSSTPGSKRIELSLAPEQRG